MPDLIWTIARFEELTVQSLHEIMALRQSVFVVEQGCIYLDADQHDHVALHFLGRSQETGQIISYLRCYEEKSGTWHLGRVIVTHAFRGMGLGIQIMERCHDFLLAQGVLELNLTAQEYAVGFYQSLGYQALGDPFMHEGLMHREMRRIHTPAPQPIRHVIFDFDGTLVDSADDYAISFQTLAQMLAPDRPLPETSVIRALMFAGVRPQIEYTLGQLSDEEFQSALEHFRAICMETPLHHTSPYPRIRELLEALKEGGCTLSVCTNRPEDLAEQALTQLELREYFHWVVGGDRGLARKPSPDMLTYLLQSSKHTAEESILVGDSEVDALAARSIGCSVALVTWGYTPAEQLKTFNPDLLCSSASQLRSWLNHALSLGSFLVYVSLIISSHTASAAPITPPQIEALQFSKVHVDLSLLKQHLDARQLSPQAGEKIRLSLWAPWCEPCLQEAKQLTRLAYRSGERLIWIRVHGESDQALLRQLGDIPQEQRGILIAPTPDERSMLLIQLSATGYGLPLHLWGNWLPPITSWQLHEGTL